VIAESDLVEGCGVPVEIEGRPIVLFASGRRVYALDDLCTHAGSRLHAGRVLGEVVACPLHGARFELATGRCRAPRIGLQTIVTHEVRVIDGQVEVALAAAPMAEPLT
jgi:3-phenylpropionate/trans-cinnamate dioxygenase ferredoxin subunit